MITEERYGKTYAKICHRSMTVHGCVPDMDLNGASWEWDRGIGRCYAWVDDYTARRLISTNPNIEYFPADKPVKAKAGRK